MATKKPLDSQKLANDVKLLLSTFFNFSDSIFDGRTDLLIFAFEALVGSQKFCDLGENRRKELFSTYTDLCHVLRTIEETMADYKESEIEITNIEGYEYIHTTEPAASA